MSAPVIHHSGTVAPCRCPDHRPIAPIRLRRRLIGLHVLAVHRARHRDHYMPEPGCPLCSGAITDEETPR